MTRFPGLRFSGLSSLGLSSPGPLATALLAAGLFSAGAWTSGGALAQTGNPASVPTPAQPSTTAGDAASGLTETVLSLSETAEVLRAPDEVRASLRAEARGANAAAVQAQVNRTMEQALAAARGVAALRATTGGYWTHRNEEARNWTATQTLNLRATEPAPLLEMVGTLQGQGLALADLSWRLSREAETAARQEAGRMAIDSLRQRAEAVATQLGMRVAGIRNLRLDAPEVPMPRMMAMSARRGDAAPAPVTAPEDVAVTSTVSADIVLRR